MQEPSEMGSPNDLTDTVAWMGAADSAGLPGHLHRRGRDALAGGRSWKSPRGAERTGAVVSVVTVEFSSLGNCRSITELRP